MRQLNGLASPVYVSLAHPGGVAHVALWLPVRDPPFQPQAGKRCHFTDRLLQIILAKSNLAGGMGFGDGSRREGLADGNQPNVPW